MTIKHLTRCPAQSPNRRGAALYVAVFSTALICSLLGLAALNIVAVEREQSAQSNDMLTARMNARAAVELALHRINNDPDWRTNYVSGAETTPQQLGPNGEGTLSWVIEDSDGSLTDEDTQLSLRGIGRVGDVVQVARAQVKETRTKPAFLKTTLHARDDVTVSGTLNALWKPVSSNATLENGGTVNGNVEAKAYTGSGTLNGSYTQTDPKPLPPETIFDDVYLPLATTIDYLALPLDEDSLTIRVLSGTLSATNNPTGGSLNPNGIYHISVPELQRLKVESLDLTGTLLVTLHSSSELDDRGSGIWQPHDSRFAVLLVKGTGLTEQSIVFKGSANKSYHGLMHVIGELTDVRLRNGFHLTGLFISHDDVVIPSSQKVTIEHDPALFDNPPLGYDYTEPGGIGIVPGSWQWDAAP